MRLRNTQEPFCWSTCKWERMIGRFYLLNTVNYYLISNSLVVEYGSFDLESWRLEGELHKGQLVSSFKLFCLHLQTLQQ